MTELERQAAECALAAVSEFCGLTPDDVLGRRRTWKHVQARHAAAFVLNVDLGLTQKAVGMFLKRDSTTICTAVSKLHNTWHSDPATRRAVFYARKAVAPHLPALADAELAQNSDFRSEELGQQMARELKAVLADVCPLAAGSGHPIILTPSSYERLQQLLRRAEKAAAPGGSW